MKIFIHLILFTIIYSNTFAQFEWTYQQSGTSRDLNSVTFKNHNTGFICGDNGVILKTTNMGNTWVLQNTGTSYNLYSITSHINYVWAAGDGGTVAYSINSGQTWNSVYVGIWDRINNISFDGSQIFCVGLNGLFVKSTNGGSNWIPIIPPASVSLNCKFGDYICGDNGLLLKQGPVGVWTQQQVNTTENLLSVYSNYGDSIYVCGRAGTILKKVNNLWIKLEPGVNEDLKQTYIIRGGAAKIKYFLGESGTLIRNVYSDSDWTPINLAANADLNSVYFTTGFSGWIAGNDGTILTTYNRQSFPAKMDANNISSWYQQTGSFNSYNLGGPGFEWPKNSGKFARYISGLLIGAEVNNDTLVDCSYYYAEFLPGYTDDSFVPSGRNDAAYRIYTLDYGVNNVDRAKWPSKFLQNSDQGAPVYFNVNTGLHEAMDLGNQTMFLRMTDSYPESHLEGCGRTLPLNVDVKLINFSFNSREDLKNVIYSHYEIINRSPNVWRNAFITFFSDDDANYIAGKVGCDTILDLGYSYSRDNNNPTYGSMPPAVGTKIIRGANYYTGNPDDTLILYLGKNKILKEGYRTKGMYSFNFFSDDGPDGYDDTYRCMEGYIFRNHGPIVTPQGDTTRYFYSGDPESASGWNMGFASYRRSFTTTGPVNINPGDTQYIVIAQVIAQGTNNLNSVTKLKEASVIAEDHYNNFFENVPVGIEHEEFFIPNEYSLSQNFPNPFNSSTVIQFSIPRKKLVSLVVYDLLGREISRLINTELEAGSYKYRLETSSLDFASGVYFFSLKTDDFTQTRKMILLK